MQQMSGTGSLAAWSSAVLQQIPHSSSGSGHPPQLHSPPPPSARHYFPHLEHSQPTSVRPTTLDSAQPHSPPTRAGDVYAAASSPFASALAAAAAADVTAVGAAPAPAGSMAPHAELAQQYSLLLSRLSLQTSALESASREAAAARADQARQNELLQALSNGFEDLWQRVENQQHALGKQQQQQTVQDGFVASSHGAAARSPSTPLSSSTGRAHAAQVHPLLSCPPSSSFTTVPDAAVAAGESNPKPSSSLSSFARTQVRSLLSALSAGKLHASEVAPLVQALEGEIDSMALRATAGLQRALEHAAEMQRRAQQGALEHAHHLAEAMARANDSAMRRRTLHAWRIQVLQRAEETKLARAHEAAAETLVQSRRVRTLARTFRSWNSLARRAAHLDRLVRARALQRREAALRQAYIQWRLRLLSVRQAHAEHLRAQLAEALSKENIDAPGRAHLEGQIEQLTQEVHRQREVQLEQKERIVRANHARKLLRSWAALASARTARAQALVPLLKRSSRLAVSHALSVWHADVVRARQRRLHVLAYTVERMESLTFRTRLGQLARGWGRWQSFVRTKERAEELRQRAEERERETKQAQEQHESLRAEVASGMAKAREEMTAQIAAERSKVLSEAEEAISEAKSAADQRVAQAEEQARTAVREADERVARERECWSAERAELVEAHRLALEESARAAAADARSLRLQVEELQLANKHVVLEMKHQERVHRELVDKQAREQAKRDVGERSVSGLLFPHQQPPTASDAAFAAAANAAAAASLAPGFGLGATMAAFTAGNNVSRDPYVNSPVFQAHLAAEVAAKHKAEVDTLARSEKKLLVERAELKARLAAVSNLYEDEHRQVKKLQKDLVAKARVGQSEQAQAHQLAQALQEAHRLRDELTAASHALDLARAEGRHAESRLTELAEQRQAVQKELEQLAQDRADMQRTYAAQIESARAEAGAKAQECVDAHRVEVASLRREHASALELLEHGHAQALAQVQARMGELESALAARDERLDSLEREGRRAQERAHAAVKDRDEVLERNRKLAASLAEAGSGGSASSAFPPHHHHSRFASSSTPSAPPPTAHRPPSHRPHQPSAPLSAASSSAASTAGVEVAALTSRPSFVLNGHAPAPVLSLTPINSLRFSPPATPPAGSLADEPWPARSPVAANGVLADEEKAREREEEVHGIVQASLGAARAYRPGSLLDLASPTAATNAAATAQTLRAFASPLPAWMPSPSAPTSSLLHSPPLRPLAFSSPFSSSLYVSGGGAATGLAPDSVAAAAAAARSRQQATLNSPLAAAATRGLTSPPAKAAMPFRSPSSPSAPSLHSSASRIDVARVFERGLAQFQ